MNVLWIFNHPAPYKIKFFNELGKKVNLQVIFERDKEGDRNDIFYSEKAYNFKMFIANSIKLGSINNYTHAPIKYLKKNKYDVVVINGWRTITERRVIKYCKRKKIPYIFAINGGIIPESEPSFKYNIKKKYISGATSYLSPDKNSNKYLVHYGAIESKINIFPYSNILENEILKKPLEQKEVISLRKKLDLEGDVIFVSSGQFIERKNYIKLIQIWAKVPSNYSLYITGEGPLKEKYQEEIKRLGLKNVKLVNYLAHPQLFALYDACDAFVFISKEDIYGHVVLEALSQGLPVIGSPNANALTKLVKEGENGHIVDINDDESILNGILNLLGPEAKLKSIEVAKQNTIEKCASFHIDLFKQYYEEINKNE